MCSVDGVAAPTLPIAPCAFNTLVLATAPPALFPWSGLAPPPAVSPRNVQDIRKRRAMPFLVRGFDVSVLLHNSLPARDSLYSVLLEARPNLFAALRQHWDGSYARSTPMSGTGYRPAISAFSALEGWWGSGYGDGDLARAMFAGARAGDATNITGCANAQQFTAAFEAARDEAFYVF